MKVETKEQTIDRLANAWPLSQTGLKNLLEMAYDAAWNTAWEQACDECLKVVES